MKQLQLREYTSNNALYLITPNFTTLNKQRKIINGISLPFGNSYKTISLLDYFVRNDKCNLDNLKLTSKYE